MRGNTSRGHNPYDLSGASVLREGESALAGGEGPKVVSQAFLYVQVQKKGLVVNRVQGLQNIVSAAQ